jgi:large subunit ribosomal protein L3
MKFIIGTKLGMTQIIDESGKVVPVTIVKAGPCTVTQLKTMERDGYSAVQLGFGESKNLAKPQIGHQKQAGSSHNILKELRLSEDSSVSIGDLVTIDNFSIGDKIKVSAISKGKGFAGTIKRHNFKRGPETHGGMNVRKPGSIGSQYPQRVLKGTRMAGRMGGTKITVGNLKIAYLNKDDNLIGIKGAVPGPNRSICYITGQNKIGEVR